ncbi:MAG TPA: alpha/beta fold hydrolase, partial [Caulobacteraceae bacterium]
MKTLGKVLLWTLLAIAVLLVAGWAVLYRADVPYETLEAKYANAESQFTGVPGAVRARYRDQGNPDGPVLVMVHGYSASLETWEPWVARLGGDYRIITLDLPGHGLTRTPPGYQPSIDAFADYVEQVTEQLGVHNFTLIGNSMGGHTAWVYALKYPQRLDGLVLVDAAGWVPDENAERPAVF